MTNKIIALLFAMSLLMAGRLRAQTSPTTLTPDFEFYLYATDALGNKDSILLGYTDDTTITLSDYGTDYGTSAFNDTLELRVTDGDRWGFTYSWKKIYTYWNCANAPQQSGLVGGFTVLAFTCQFPPISFSWDMAAFQQDSCRDNSVISVNSDYMQHPYINSGLHAVLSNESNMILTLDTARQNWYNYPDIIYPNQLTTNGRTDTVYTVHIAFANDPISIDVRKTNQSNTIRVFPTLASDYLHLDIQDLREPVTVRIYNLYGQLVHQDYNSPTTLPIHYLPQGSYIVEVHTDKRTTRQQIARVE